MIRELEFGSFDVLIAGGGMAGIAAAIAAARNGVKTILIEKSGFLGGLGVIGATALHNFFNIFDATPGAKPIRVAAGIAQELVDRAKLLGGAIGHVHLEKGGKYISMVTPVEPEIFKVVAVRACLEAGVKLLFHTIVEQVQSTNGHIDGVVIWNKGGHGIIRAKQFIDCTGDGDLAAFAGAPFIHFKANEPGAYLAGFTFRLCNIDLERMEADLKRKNLISMLGHAIKPGMAKLDLVRIGINIRKLKFKKSFYFYASSLRPRELTYCNCINYGPNDGLDAEMLSNAEIYMREVMLDVVNLFQKSIDGCEECYAAGAAPAVGQRRARAIHCVYELTREDCLFGKHFDDQIGCFSFIDAPGMLVKDSGAYGIPYRALIPLEVDNLLIAGRMMTPDNVAFASTRNTVCCMICGQAAGIAASLAVKNGTSPLQVNVTTLQDRLSRAGVLLKPKPTSLQSIND